MLRCGRMALMLETAQAAMEPFDLTDELDRAVEPVKGDRGAVEKTLGIFHPDPERVERACRELSHLPRRVASRFARRLPSHVETEELIAAGALGLVTAVQQHLDKPDAEL